MSKNTRALSGAAKNTFLDGIVRSALGEDHAARDRLLLELTAAVASLRVRVEAERGRKGKKSRSSEVEVTLPPPADQAYSELVPGDFDPFSPNVIVVVRTKGRDAALAALASITREDQLRQLSHEQQLSIPAEVRTAADMRTAIVEAAERRIANRRAAGR